MTGRNSERQAGGRRGVSYLILSLRKGFMVWRTASLLLWHLTPSILEVTEGYSVRLLSNRPRDRDWKRWKVNLGYRDANFLAYTLQVAGHMGEES